MKIRMIEKLNSIITILATYNFKPNLTIMEYMVCIFNSPNMRFINILKYKFTPIFPMLSISPIENGDQIFFFM
jgi:hypothetical protein